MPFTPAHSAIVLPFLKTNARFVSATGLVIGSLVPDFEYFLKFSVDGKYGHTLPGIFYFDLPLCLLLSVGFHQIVKHNLIANLPTALQQRLSELKNSNFLEYLKTNKIAFILSACLGAASHIFWDSFTHGNGYFVQVLPFYRGNFIHFNGANYPLWYALQHLSTYFGLLIVSWYLIQLPVEKEKHTTNPNISYWTILLAITAIITLLRFLIYSADLDIGNFVVSTISAFCISLVICGMIKFENKSI